MGSPRQTWRSIPPGAVFVECPDCLLPVLLTSKDAHRDLMHPSWPCCDLHKVGVSVMLAESGAPVRIGACCDPDDCGPCCENCPTCPTLQRERSRIVVTS
jgi:hypothetical protein